MESKKELTKRVKAEIKNILDNGETNITQLYAEMLRKKEEFLIYEKELRNHLEPVEAFGMQVTEKNGGLRLNFSDDTEIANLEEQIAERKELLKLAYKTKGIMLEDDQETIVPKVSAKDIGMVKVVKW